MNLIKLIFPEYKTRKELKETIVKLITMPPRQLKTETRRIETIAATYLVSDEHLNLMKIYTDDYKEKILYRLSTLVAKEILDQGFYELAVIKDKNSTEFMMKIRILKNFKE